MDDKPNPTPTTETRRGPDWPQTLRLVVRRTWPFVVAILAAFLGVYLYSLLFPAPAPLGQNEIDESIAQAMASATPPPPYSTQVYQAILPSLVLIQTQREHAADNDAGDDEFFRMGQT